MNLSTVFRIAALVLLAAEFGYASVGFEVTHMTLSMLAGIAVCGI